MSKHTCRCGHNVEDHMPMDFDPARGCAGLIEDESLELLDRSYCDCVEFRPEDDRDD
jgi:hypothetical protein